MKSATGPVVVYALKQILVPDEASQGVADGVVEEAEKTNVIRVELIG